MTGSALPEPKEFERQVRGIAILASTRDAARQKGEVLGRELRKQIPDREDSIAQRHATHPIVYEALLVRLSRDKNVLVAHVADAALVAFREPWLG